MVGLCGVLNSNQNKRRRKLPVALAADASRELHILGHDGHPLGVECAHLRVFKQCDQVSLGGFLQCAEGRACESQIRLDALGDLTDKTLKGQLLDKELRRLLKTTDLAKGDLQDT